MSSGLATYTAIHVILSLAGIVSGLVVLSGFLSSRQPGGFTPVFLWTTLLTSLTGFGFPFTHVLPSHIVGALSLGVLAIAIFARYGRRLAGGWRWAYVVSAMTALYFNCFVLVVQVFLKVPALKSLAPTQSEPPFVVVQLVVLAAFVMLTIAAAVKFHPAQQRRAAA
ncbi:MAG TPA: hypothetical protein VLV86_06845 [Vicinamibacterales bacterium]|nr:hypothetical protein [Vicinamibacterales bacterium]